MFDEDDWMNGYGDKVGAYQVTADEVDRIADRLVLSDMLALIASKCVEVESDV